MNAADLAAPPAQSAEVEAEAGAAVLGALLLAPEWLPQVRALLAESDFRLASHRAIYRTLVRLEHEGEPIDTLTLGNALRVTGDLDRIGGIGTISGLAAGTPSAANVLRYAAIVAQKARLRELAGLAAELHAGATSAQADLGELVRKAGATLSRLANAGAGAAVEIIRGDTVTPEAVSWLWPGHIACKKIHIVGGAPGTGKTTLVLGFLAAITCGGRWPDGTRAPLGDVAIWSGEDGIEDTLAPRLLACGADMSRVHFIGSRRDDDARRPFDPSKDFPTLEHEAARIPALRALMVDPIVSTIAGDSHKNAETRRGLQPLADFGEHTGCAIVGVTHFTKGTAGRDPVERLTGSLAFGAVARVVLVTVKQPEAEGGARLLIRAKSNIGPDGGGFRYELRQVELEGEHAGIPAMRPEYLGAVEGDARAILDAAEAQADPEERGARAEAEAFLRDALTGGPMPAKQLHADAKGSGIAERTLWRAKSKLGVVAVKEAMSGGWHWRLPTKSAAEPCQFPEQENMAAFGQVGTLREGNANPAKDYEGCQEIPKAATKVVRRSWQTSDPEAYQRAKDGE